MKFLFLLTQVKAGQSSSFALKKIKRGEIRKGMVLVSPNSNPQGFPMISIR